jgi:hypothetical protein
VAAARWEQSGEGGDSGAVDPADPRPRCASLDHCQLMAQDEDLDLLGVLESGVQHAELSSFANIW